MSRSPLWCARRRRAPRADRKGVEAAKRRAVVLGQLLGANERCHYRRRRAVVRQAERVPELVPRDRAYVVERVACSTRREDGEAHVGKEGTSVVGRHERGATSGAEGELAGGGSAREVALPRDDDVGTDGVRSDLEGEAAQ